MAKTKKNTAAEKASEVVETTPVAETETAEATETVAPVKKQRVRSKKYVSARGLVDKTHTYSINEAVALAKKTHYGKFTGSLQANLLLRDGDISLDVAFPYSTGRTITVAIVTDELIAEIQKGVLNFTALVAHPSFMPKLARLAPVLGPKGLMPNPKNGTLTADPEKRKKELESGAITVKSEKKAPLVHVVLGKLSQPDTELAENLQALLKAFPVGKVLKCVISASMGPGVKVTLI